MSDTQAASVLAGIGTRILLHPIDSVKTRVQRVRSRNVNAHVSLQTARQVLRAQGIAGLYRGLFGALLGVLPYSMCT